MKPSFLNCTNCTGSEMRPLPNGQQGLVCKRRGPFPVAIPQMVQTPQGPTMGFNMLSIYTPVSQLDSCGQHEFIKDASKLTAAN